MRKNDHWIAELEGPFFISPTLAYRWWIEVSRNMEQLASRRVVSSRSQLRENLHTPPHLLPLPLVRQARVNGTAT